eukprot:TRINITY_DN4523_c0_g1_i6.p1 TRINITY_DN4523_c0_g1~~TRINITY_DN4523_c0_g1_i6.p1  ORF type:complete len:957 (+),score=142.23 TRINITY_DN4523_c0_g1_i6:55-2925(+)
MSTVVEIGDYSGESPCAFQALAIRDQRMTMDVNFGHTAIAVADEHGTELAGFFRAAGQHTSIQENGSMARSVEMQKLDTLPLHNNKVKAFFVSKKPLRSAQPSQQLQLQPQQASRQRPQPQQPQPHPNPAEQLQLLPAQQPVPHRRPQLASMPADRSRSPHRQGFKGSGKGIVSTPVFVLDSTNSDSRTQQRRAFKTDILNVDMTGGWHSRLRGLLMWMTEDAPTDFDGLAEQYGDQVSYFGQQAAKTQLDLALRVVNGYLQRFEHLGSPVKGSLHLLRVIDTVVGRTGNGTYLNSQTSGNNRNYFVTHFITKLLEIFSNFESHEYQAQPLVQPQAQVQAQARPRTQPQAQARLQFQPQSVPYDRPIEVLSAQTGDNPAVQAFLQSMQREGGQNIALFHIALEVGDILSTITRALRWGRYATHFSVELIRDKEDNFVYPGLKETGTAFLKIRPRVRFQGQSGMLLELDSMTPLKADLVDVRVRAEIIELEILAAPRKPYAVVIGGGPAGMVAAAMLSERYEVIILTTSELNDINAVKRERPYPIFLGHLFNSARNVREHLKYITGDEGVSYNLLWEHVGKHFRNWPQVQFYYDFVTMLYKHLIVPKLNKDIHAFSNVNVNTYGPCDHLSVANFLVSIGERNRAHVVSVDTLVNLPGVEVVVGAEGAHSPTRQWIFKEKMPIRFDESRDQDMQIKQLAAGTTQRHDLIDVVLTYYRLRVQQAQRRHDPQQQEAHISFKSHLESEYPGNRFIFGQHLVQDADDPNIKWQVGVITLDETQKEMLREIEALRAGDQQSTRSEPYTFQRPCSKEHFESTVVKDKMQAHSEFKTEVDKFKQILETVFADTEHHDWNLSRVKLNIYAAIYSTHFHKKLTETDAGACKHTLVTITGDALNGSPWFRSAIEGMETSALVASTLLSDENKSLSHIAFDLEKKLKDFVAKRAEETHKLHAEYMKHLQ